MVTAVGWAVILLGLLFLLLGLVEAIRRVFGDPPKLAGGGIDWGAFIEALVKAGLFNIAIGLALLILGLRMIGVDVFPATD